MNWKLFFQGIFSDNGVPSFSRVASAVALGFACGWVTHLVVKNNSLPDFMGLCMFIGVFYGTNVAGSVAKVFKPNPQDPPKEGGQ